MNADKIRHTVLTLLALICLLPLSTESVLSQSVQGTGSTLGPSISISNLSPPISTRLRPGAKVKFRVEIEYALHTDHGAIGMFVQRSEAGFAPLAYVGKQITKGVGKTVLEVEAEIPVTRTIQIFVPLYTDVTQSTSVVDGRVYEVARP